LMIKKEINKEEEINELKIVVSSEIRYVDYYEYEFNIKNNSSIMCIFMCTIPFFYFQCSFFGEP